MFFLAALFFLMAVIFHGAGVIVHSAWFTWQGLTLLGLLCLALEPAPWGVLARLRHR